MSVMVLVPVIKSRNGFELSKFYFSVRIKNISIECFMTKLSDSYSGYDHH
jgi:hypothetical protein